MPRSKRRKVIADYHKFLLAPGDAELSDLWCLGELVDAAGPAIVVRTGSNVGSCGYPSAPCDLRLKTWPTRSHQEAGTSGKRSSWTSAKGPRDDDAYPAGREVILEEYLVQIWPVD